MKYLITGLGNPGADYKYNRHNVGFMVLDQLAAANGLEFSQDRHGYTLNLKIKGRQLLLLKPTTFMNLSGKAVRFHLANENIDLENLLVITDDLALPFGKLRLRAKGSSGGHNGLENIIQVLGSRDWARLRFGIGDEFKNGKQIDYVLSDFSPGEQIDLPTLLDRSIEIIHAFCTIGVAHTMTQYNQK